MLLSLCGLIGIMSAMPEEGALIIKNMNQTEIVKVAGREFYKGQLEDKDIVFCLAGIGKVSAATTASLMIDKFGVEKIIFTGVAGGGDDTEVGDVVIGKNYIQHDLDLTPIYPKFYMYSLQKQILEADHDLVMKLEKAAKSYLDKKSAKVHVGLVLSGDQFIYSEDQRSKIFSDLQHLDLESFHAIEMEGAAVAQVCHEFDLPFGVIRAISDKANSKSEMDFPKFIKEVASEYSLGILKEYLRNEKEDTP